MIVVVDAKNPFLSEALAPYCTVRTLPTGEITHAALKDADAVVVRSETHVDAGLLDGTRVRFVGTATIGTDHVDTGYLTGHGIGFASAPGSNANSVAEYLVTALLVVAGRLGLTLRGLTLGVVGVGNVGSRVVRVGEALGMRVLLNDPPLARKTGDPRYLPVDALMDADVLTLHVPLTTEGMDATYHLWDAHRIDRMKTGSVLVNTSRGGVVDSGALLNSLVRKHLRAAVLDVWEHEPGIDPDLLERVLLGTPHIAGYSFDGKVNAARMMFEALSAHFGLGLPWPEPASLPPPRCSEITVQLAGSEEDTLRGILTRCYDIEDDDARLRATAAMNAAERAKEFRRLRSQYPVRREFAATLVQCEAVPQSLRAILAALGYACHPTSTEGCV